MHNVTLIITPSTILCRLIYIHLHTEQGNVAQDRVEVHEDILDHDVDIGSSPLDDVLIGHPSKYRAQTLLHKGDFDI